MNSSRPPGLLLALSLLWALVPSHSDGAGVDYASTIQNIYNSKCTSCHSATVQSGSLNLSSGVSYANTVNIASVGHAPAFRVRPNVASGTSFNYAVIVTQGTAANHNGGTWTTTTAERTAFTDWINQGALANASPPTVTSVSPNTGTIAGGTVVTLTGTNFGGTGSFTPVVTFGGTPATNVVVATGSFTRITCTVPAHASGPVPVVVSTTTGGPSAALANGFTYTGPPTVTTPTSASIAATAATLGGNVTSDGSATITSRGVVYSVTATNSNPVIGGAGVTVVTTTGTVGVFTVNVTGLTPATAYSFKAFATNSAGTTYTTPVSNFTTTGSPLVSSPTSTGIGSNTATLGGNVTSDGGAPITTRGIVYSATATNSDPLIGGAGVTLVPAGGTTGVFAVTANGLAAATAYSFKAFATNSVGTTYTTPVSSFTTTPPAATAPLVGAPTSTGIGSNTATLGATVTSDGGAPVTARGIVYSTSASNGDPLIGGAGVTLVPAGGTTGVFAVTANGLAAATAYSFKAFATNSVGTTYTTPVSSFTTTPPAATAPLVSAPTSTGIGSNTATLGATVTSDGGAPVTARGIVYSTSASNGDPLIGGAGVTLVPAGGTTGVFAVTANGLAAATAYSFKAFATNSVGTTYTTPVSSFTTTPPAATAPLVGAPTSTGIGSNTATLGATVTSDGGAPVTARGIVYSTSASNGDPLIGGAGVTMLPASGTTGVFTVTANGLAAATAYFFKAFATNSVGTTYTTPVSSFTTSQPPITAPIVSAPTIANIGTTNATLGGNVTSDGGAPIVARGIVYSATTTNNNPQMGGAGVTMLPASGTTGAFTVTAVGLTASTSYSFNVFATNSVGTTYTTPAATFTTNPVAPVSPTVIDPTSASIGTSSATLGGNVASDGGATITTRGIVYSLTATNSNPEIGGNGVTVLAASGNLGVFTVTANSLAPASSYSFKAFATNGIGTTYTTPVSSFTTNAVATPPTVNSPTSTSIGPTTATLGGNVTSDGGAPITSRGVVYSVTSTNSNPQIGGSGVITLAAAGTIGAFSLNATNLTAATGYSFKAFATNSLGTTYTTPVSSFTTAPPPATSPILASPTSTNIGPTTATLGGNVTMDGGAPITVRGIVYSATSTNSNPQISGSDVFILTASGTVGAFSVEATNLTALTGYSFRAFATNSIGTSYTTPVSSFTTASPSATSPTVGSPTSTNIGPTTATLGGNVTTDGGAPITVRGIVYSPTSTNSNPQLGGSGVITLTASGTVGAFSVDATSLTPATTYSFKAFATNGVGTTYTTPVSSFITAPQSSIAPTIGAPESTNISATTATLGANVTSDGGAPITARGIVYSVTATNSIPEIGGTGVTVLTISGTIGAFTVDAMSLSPATGYSFRAFATNSAATTYTVPTSSFTTSPPAPSRPSINAPTSVAIGNDTATLGGTITDDGGAPITVRGIVFSESAINSDPQIGGPGVTMLATAGTTGVFTVTATALTRNTIYSFKAFATNSAGTSYTTPASTFTTTNPNTASPPVVADPTSTNVTATEARLGGNVASDGGAAIIARGVVYSITEFNDDPRIGGAGVTALTAPGTVGAFTVDVIDLLANRPYSFKAFATNSAGTTYTTPVSTFTTSDPSRPSNDNFANARDVVGNSGRIRASNSNGTKEAGEPNHADREGGSSIWYRWSATETGTVTFDTFESDFDTLLAVYTGSAVNALVKVAANDDARGSQSRVSFDAIAGTLYYIAVDGFEGATGGVDLQYYQGSIPAPGTYYGLVVFDSSGPSGYNHAHSGSLKLTITETSKFTGTLVYAGQSVPLLGTFAGKVGVSGTMPIPQHGAIDLSLSGAVDRIAGTIEEKEGATAVITAYRNPFDKKANPAPQAGTYTLLSRPLDPFIGRAEIPQGIGAGKVIIDAGGTSKVVGTLGDGTKYTIGSALSGDGTMPLYAITYGKLGSIQGMASFEEIAGESDASATLSWSKPHLNADFFYPEGFNTQLKYLISRYSISRGERVLPVADTTNNLRVSLSWGGIDPISPFSLTLDRRNRFVGNGEIGLRLKVIPRAGTFKGSFRDPSTSAKRKLSGAIFQKQGIGSGLFKGSGQTGPVLLQPNVAPPATGSLFRKEF